MTPKRRTSALIFILNIITKSILLIFALLTENHALYANDFVIGTVIRATI